MPPVSRRFGVRTLVLLALALVSLHGAGLPSAGAAGTPSSVGMLRICTNCSSYGLNRAGAYRYVVLHAWQSSLIPQLKAANPSIKVLVYKDMAATFDYACSGGVDKDYPAGIGYCAADASHPEWFLKDTNGARIEFCDYSGLWQMDVGNASYQDAWRSNVAADLRARGFDGVVVDDANWTERSHLCGRTIAKYPTDSDYGAATRSFLARVGPALTSQGFLVLPNIALPYFSSNYDVWSDWISFTSGAIQEHFSKWGTDGSQQFADADWKYRQGFLPLTERAGKIFLGITYAPMSDVRSMTYARGNFLLDWDGGPSALIFEPSNPEAQDPFSASWTQDIGTPLAARYQVGAAWRRDFSGGTVVVNPSGSATQSVALGAPFVAADGSTVTSVTLAPTTAAILKGQAAASAPPPSPAPPAVQTPPKISGTEKVGKTLSATAGTWSGSPTSFSYSWARCDAQGANCVPVTDAGAAAYTTSAADAGRTLRVSVTARNAGGAATATSAATAPVKGAIRVLAFVGAVDRQPTGAVGRHPLGVRRPASVCRRTSCAARRSGHG
jgi:putative glycosyl hydrolase-like family 15 (GHL15) protein